MGYEPGSDEPISLSNEDRRRILDSLEKGDISYQEAMRKLGEGEV